MKFPLVNLLKLRPVIQIDLRWRDFFSALICIIKPKHKEQAWPYPGSQTCFSVRSGFDQLLAILKLPKGSEVILGAITIPDMIAIITANGLIPKFVDLDPITHQPSMIEIEQALNENVRVILVTQLFGRHFSLDKIAQKIKNRSIIVIEDCAQAFNGTYKGSPFADACIFSFGPIKKHTALGGAKIFIKNETLAKQFEASLNRLPTISETWFFRQIIKYSMLKALSSPPFYGILNQISKYMNIDPDKLLYKLSRSFGGADINKKLKFKLPRGASAFLNKRLSLLQQSKNRVNNKPWVRIVSTANKKQFVEDYHSKGLPASHQLGSLKYLSPKGSCPNAERILESIAFI